MGWTPELVKELKRLWNKGLTTVEIGNQLGMSKNAVVGKAHRLNLEARPSPIKRDNIKHTVKKVIETRSATKPATKKTAPEASANTPAEVVFETEPLPPEINIHKSKKHKGVALVDLKPTSCRWPEGDPKDPNFHFCGEPVEPGKIYCPAHCAIAYTGIFKAK